MSNYTQTVDQQRRNLIEIIEGMRLELGEVEKQLSPLEVRRDRILKSIGAHKGYLAVLDSET